MNKRAGWPGSRIISIYYLQDIFLPSALEEDVVEGRKEGSEGSIQSCSINRLRGRGQILAHMGWVACLQPQID